MAEENLQDLVDRNLVSVENRRADCRIKTCRIHDMLHDMCIKQAEEENFFKEIKGLEPSSYVSVDPNVFHRLCVHSRVVNYISSKPDPSHVCSFLCYAKEEKTLPNDMITYFPRSFKLLRVLDVRPNLQAFVENWSLFGRKKGCCKFDNITRLTHLENLKLLNDTYPTPPLDGKLHNLPEWYKFSPKLKRLTMFHTMLDWEGMAVLGKLSGLEVLKLGDNVFVGERWETPGGGICIPFH
ncbi:hypothetical protein L2E82_10948 [Cichorium intybus]|uniref:Uncharacterized protein n=1 Tax=Cichorium intybus TaxID=13427 RepID=A0ACB9GBU0_CICIN|nr:hypothetical protein L2E82_10948 [Cichorium intybus]